jgi:hypothetical protein
MLMIFEVKKSKYWISMSIHRLSSRVVCRGSSNRETISLFQQYCQMNSLISC